MADGKLMKKNGVSEWRCDGDWPCTQIGSEGEDTASPLRLDLVADPAKEDRFKFQNLVKQWRSERGARSSITETATMPAYQQIIGMGMAAFPLIIEQLRSEGDDPDQWFWALRAITEANPVKPEEQGDFRKMAQAWLRWAESVYAW